MLDVVQSALVIAPHPDDETLGCGGTIARLTQAGKRVDVVIVTRADPPNFSKDVVSTGRREAKAAHDLLGVARTHYLDFPAAELDQVPLRTLNAAIGDLVTATRPDTLFVPFVGDVHVDHQLVFQAALVAARPRHDHAPLRVYAYETLSETNWYAPGVTPTFAPNVYVDVDTTIETKIAAFACFASQVKSFPDERSFEAIRALAAVRGATVHRRAAEAFMLIRQIC